MNYIYKINKKTFKSLGEDDVKDLFPNYIDFKENEDSLYATPVTIPTHSSIVKGLIGVFNDPKWQKNANITINSKDEFEAANGIKFVMSTRKNGKYYETVYAVDETEELLTELASEWQIAFETTGDYAYIIYLTSTDDTYPSCYANSKILEEHCQPLLKKLLEKKVIYKTPAPGEKEEQESVHKC